MMYTRCMVHATRQVTQAARISSYCLATLSVFNEDSSRSQLQVERKLQRCHHQQQHSSPGCAGCVCLFIRQPTIESAVPPQSPVSVCLWQERKSNGRCRRRHYVVACAHTHTAPDRRVCTHIGGRAPARHQQRTLCVSFSPPPSSASGSVGKSAQGVFLYSPLHSPSSARSRSIKRIRKEGGGGGPVHFETEQTLRGDPSWTIKKKKKKTWTRRNETPFLSFYCTELKDEIFAGHRAPSAMLLGFDVAMTTPS